MKYTYIIISIRELELREFIFCIDLGFRMINDSYIDRYNIYIYTYSVYIKNRHVKKENKFK